MSTILHDNRYSFAATCCDLIVFSSLSAPCVYAVQGYLHPLLLVRTFIKLSYLERNITPRPRNRRSKGSQKQFLLGGRDDNAVGIIRRQRNKLRSSKCRMSPYLFFFDLTFSEIMVNRRFPFF